MMKKGVERLIHDARFIALLVCLLGSNVVSGVLGQGTPKARAPLVPRITSVDQLVPFAKVIIQRDYIGQRLGWSVRGGERVLYETSRTVHPWVREAFIKALKELNCTVDVVVLDEPRRGDTDWEEVVRLTEERLALDLNTRPSKRFGHGGSGPPRPSVRRPGIRVSEEEASQYDAVIGRLGRGSGAAVVIEGLGGADYLSTPELLASAGEVYPGDLMDLIDAKSWAIIRNSARVEITDLQGSEASFTWFPEWWELVEGTHPKIRGPGHLSTFGTLARGRSEYAVFAGHLMAVPRYGAIEQTDFKGKLVATMGQDVEGPRITVWHDRGGITRIDGGGAYGDMWRKVLEMTKDIQYPGYPRPGTHWIQEFSIGTNPKIIGPMEVAELKGIPGRDTMPTPGGYMSWGRSRDRAGAVHAGYGARGASWWATTVDMPVNHYHLRLFFVDYTVRSRDGKTVKLLDKGHLTTLDDPDVRALAAKYGDPDKMLSPDWVPELTPDGVVKPPKAKLVSYEEFIAGLPFKLHDPRVVYRIASELKKFYGEDRIKYYKHDDFVEFYRKLGQLPIKRVQ